MHWASCCCRASPTPSETGGFSNWCCLPLSCYWVCTIGKTCRSIGGWLQMRSDQTTQLFGCWAAFLVDYWWREQFILLLCCYSTSHASRVSKLLQYIQTMQGQWYSRASWCFFYLAEVAVYYDLWLYLVQHIEIYWHQTDVQYFLGQLLKCDLVWLTHVTWQMCNYKLVGAVVNSLILIQQLL